MNRWLALGWIGWAMAGCGSPEPVELQWMEGAGFGWHRFNHRLSHLEFRLADDEAQVAVIGGTSTTGEPSRVDDTCDPAACMEVPVLDDADVTLWVARAEAPGVVLGRQTVPLTVGPDGAQERVQLSLSGPAAEHTVAVIGGLRLTTDLPLLGGDFCYAARFGWLPRRLMFEVGEPEVRGDRVELDLSAAFHAGLTLEEMRRCLDAAIDYAQVALEIDLLVVSGPGEAGTFPVASSAEFAYGSRGSPELQELPAPAGLGIAVDEALVGFSAVDFRFHDADPEHRGAYLRTLEFSAAEGKVLGGATNYSPGTQLSGFEYQFSGVVRTLQLGAPVERIRLAAELPAALDEQGEPVVHSLPLEGFAGP